MVGRPYDSVMIKTVLQIEQLCVGVLVWPVAVDITMMISDREGIPQVSQNKAIVQLRGVL